MAYTIVTVVIIIIIIITLYLLSRLICTVHIVIIMTSSVSTRGSLEYWIDEYENEKWGQFPNCFNDALAQSKKTF
jgi:hypothetical protein